MRVRETLLETKAIVDVQVNAKSKSVSLLASKDDMTEEKVTEMLKRKGFKVTSFKAEKLGKIGG